MKVLKEKLIKAKKLKFAKNVFVGIILLIIAAIIVNVAPGYKRDKFTNVTNLIINEENKTEELVHDIYINEDGTVYLSQDDVKKIFDENIFYDEKYNQIITTSDTKVAVLKANNNKITVNDSEVNLLDSIIKIDNVIYLPISDMGMVYNIEVSYIKETNRLIIDDLNKGLIKATVTEDTAIKFKPRRFSKNIGELTVGEPVYAFYTTSKGWRQVRTTNGIIGYIKANKLGKEYILRQDMEEREAALTISKKDYQNRKIEIEDNESVKIIDVFSENEENIKTDDNIKLWTIVSNKPLEEKINDMINDYKLRTDLIDTILEKTVKNDVRGVIVDFGEISNTNNSLQRFIIELTPRLREIGIDVALVLNENINKQDYINIVDYVIE